jgi:hypothetical protein
MKGRTTPASVASYAVLFYFFHTLPMADEKSCADKMDNSRQGNKERDLGNVDDNSDKERLVKADDDNTPHLENMKNVQGSNKDDKVRR